MCPNRKEVAMQNPFVDLSKIDFDQLWERFRTGRKHIEGERLRGAIGRKLSEMIPRNRTRMDYQERFEQMIAAYNEAAINVDVLFDQLMEPGGRTQRGGTTRYY